MQYKLAFFAFLVAEKLQEKSNGQYKVQQYFLCTEEKAVEKLVILSNDSSTKSSPMAFFKMF